MYHIGDYIRLLWHGGPKKVIWCGSDVINLTESYIWKRIIPRLKATHKCENDIEAYYLQRLGIKPEIQPMYFDDKEFEVCYKQSDNPHVYITCHPKYEEEYGVNEVEKIAPMTPDITYHIYGVEKERWLYSNDMQAFNLSCPSNVIYHGKVSEDQFNEEIKGYQAALRLNTFDGFSEILAKSVLMGQYPISFIDYPFIQSASSENKLISLLNSLKDKKEPNYESREYWLKEFNKPL